MISAATLLAFAGSLGLDYVMIRFLPTYEKGRSSLINLSITVVAIATALVCIIYLAGVPWWSPAFLPVRDSPIYAAGFIVFGVATVISGQAVGTFIGLRRAESVLTQGAINSIVKLALAAVLVLFFGGFFGIFAAWGLAAMFSLVVSILFLLPRLLPRYRYRMTLKRQMTGEMVRFSLGNYLSNGFWSLPQWVLPLVIVNVLGAAENAYFFIAFGVSGILFAVPYGTSTSLFAEGSKEAQHLSRDLVRSLKLTMAILIPGIVVLATVGDKILLLFGHAYSVEGARLFWFLAPAALPMSITFLYLGACRVEKKLKELVLVPSAIAVGILVLSAVLIRPLGTEGIAIAWLAGHITVALVLAPKFVGMCRKAVR